MILKPDYGIDAPGVIRNLLLAAACGVAMALFAPARLTLGPVQFAVPPTGWGIGISCGGGGLLMLLYAKLGKFRHRDKMLKLHHWRGDERVLDVGTGRGLLLIGAARRITTGHATGMDIWNAEDLSGNALERTEANIACEGVADKCSLTSEGAQKMSFRDASFDVVLSNLCLHNIYDRPTRLQACREIARVLKPGGVAILSDYKHVGEYSRAMREMGLQVELKAPNLFTTYPPLRILVARKA
ncbi:MAG TPA: class I SAM-dependent methyltransferase [Acidobacteriaceae bacterium]|nr:class I SAM-dependent methyltransferase [Acidobacteriaceae bacterium]